VRNQRTGEARRLTAALVVNAAGAWAGQIAGMAGCPVTVRPSAESGNLFGDSEMCS
jgi:Glycerol-3-phosphate dehydrogenase